MVMDRNSLLLSYCWYYYVELDSNSIPHMLELIFPKLEDQVMMAKNVQLIDALQVCVVLEVFYRQYW